jgi:aspartyl/asparaginyl beta-hydroxylase (cupin superfamily)
MQSRLKRAIRDPGKAITFLVNKLFFWASDGERRPAFYDIDSVRPELRILDRNYEIIRKEMESVLRDKDRIPRYHEITPRETYISGTFDQDKSWRVFMLVSLAGIPRSNQARCPETTKLVHQIPNVIQAFYSILDPGKSIPAHCGTYMGYLRYHLALRVPKNNPPSMRVKDQRHTWEEGKSIVFDDSWDHDVYNKSDDIRVVLIVDFLRPMPMVAHAVNKLATKLVPHTEEAKNAMAQIEKPN